MHMDDDFIKDCNITLPKMISCALYYCFLTIMFCSSLFCVNISCVSQIDPVLHNCLFFHSEVNRCKENYNPFMNLKLSNFPFLTFSISYLPACPAAVCSVTFDFFHIVFFLDLNQRLQENKKIKTRNLKMFSSVVESLL